MIQAETRAFLFVIGLFMEQELFYFLITDKFISGIKKPPGIIPDGVKINCVILSFSYAVTVWPLLAVKNKIVPESLTSRIKFFIWQSVFGKNDCFIFWP